MRQDRFSEKKDIWFCVEPPVSVRLNLARSRLSAIAAMSIRGIEVVTIYEENVNGQVFLLTESRPFSQCCNHIMEATHNQSNNEQCIYSSYRRSYASDSLERLPLVVSPGIQSGR